MPTENRVTFKLSDELITDAKNAIITLKRILAPHFVSLSDEERQELPKMSDKSLAFVTKCLHYAKTNPEFAPNYLDIPALEEDVVNADLLIQFLNLLTAITKGLDDTAMLAGSEAYTASLSYYNTVKQGAKQNVPNAKIIYEDLKTRFPRKPGKKEEPEN
jgi:hypothetical protein